MHGYHGSDYRLRVESLSTFLRAWKHRAEVIAAEVRAISEWARRRRRHKRCRHWALGCAIMADGSDFGEGREITVLEPAASCPLGVDGFCECRLLARFFPQRSRSAWQSVEPSRRASHGDGRPGAGRVADGAACFVRLEQRAPQWVVSCGRRASSRDSRPERLSCPRSERDSIRETVAE